MAFPNWSIALQDEAAPLIVQYAEKYSIPLDIAFSMVAQESGFKPSAYRFEPRINDASYGLAQILYRTAQGLGYRGEPTGLYDPATNLDLGFRYLRNMYDRFGTWEQAISAYNEGPATATIGNPGYVQSVLDRAAWFVDSWRLGEPLPDAYDPNAGADLDRGGISPLWVAGLVGVVLLATGAVAIGRH